MTIKKKQQCYGYQCSIEEASGQCPFHQCGARQYVNYKIINLFVLTCPHIVQGVIVA